MSADVAGMRLWAVRGAVKAEANTEKAILAATTELLSELTARNDLRPERIVSCLFTCTDELDAQFPAVAARSLGFEGVPLLCTREIAVPGSMPNVIRLLAHYYGPPDREPAHTYIGEAQALRSDLHAAQ